MMQVMACTLAHLSFARLRITPNPTSMRLSSLRLNHDQPISCSTYTYSAADNSQFATILPDKADLSCQLLQPYALNSFQPYLSFSILLSTIAFGRP